jgi:uncharacterized protein (DUF2336 family)
VAQGQSANLARLEDIASRAHGRLGEVYLAVSALFEHQGSAFSERERVIASEVLKRLSKDVEMSIRIGLAERIVANPGAPHELLMLLADDRIDVARPLLERSAAFSERDLVHIVESGSPDHQKAVAERPFIGEIVSAVLARSESEAVIIALLRNKSAAIGAATFDALSLRSRHCNAIQAPLIGRDDLPPALASRLYGSVSDALKTALAGRFPHVAQSLSQALDETTHLLQSGAPSETGPSAEKLIAKLLAAGQLRPSFLIRVLNQGQMDLFEHGFSALLEMDLADLREALYGRNPAKAALACRAAGIDRSVFMTVFNLSRHHRRVSIALAETDRWEIQSIFNTMPKIDALNRLKSAAA